MFEGLARTDAALTPDERVVVERYLRGAIAVLVVVYGLVLAAVLISAGNAIVRKAFNIGSNAWLEIQWYLFAGVFMLGVGYVMLKNAHVRIDFISSRLSKRTNAIIDAIGIIVFTIPLSIIMIRLGWPLFEQAWRTGEMSQNAGGLIRWPVLMLVPLGFAVLLSQALSDVHLVKVPTPFLDISDLVWAGGERGLPGFVGPIPQLLLMSSIQLLDMSIAAPR